MCCYGAVGVTIQCLVIYDANSSSKRLIYCPIDDIHAEETASDTNLTSSEVTVGFEMGIIMVEQSSRKKQKMFMKLFLY